LARRCLRRAPAAPRRISRRNANSGNGKSGSITPLGEGVGGVPVGAAVGVGEGVGVGA